MAAAATASTATSLHAMAMTTNALFDAYEWPSRVFEAYGSYGSEDE